MLLDKICSILNLHVFLANIVSPSRIYSAEHFEESTTYYGVPQEHLTVGKKLEIVHKPDGLRLLVISFL